MNPARWVLAALSLAGCAGEVAEARPQWVVRVETDAPVPALGTRLFLEVADGEDRPLPGGSRVFGLTAERTLPFSFGVEVPSDGARRAVRAVLYRATQTGASGLPRGRAIIQAAGELPAAGGEVLLRLHLSCFGVTAEEEPSAFPRRVCAPESGALEPLPLLATDPEQAVPWTARTPVLACAERAVPDDMTCVEGGLFIQGDPLDLASEMAERLVELQTFALDTDEFTVAALRELERSGAVTLEDWAGSLVAYDGATPDPLAEPRACTYDPSGAFDDRPLNCVGPELAAALCAARGKRLPTEAEWEYAAGNGALETPYPWGSSEEFCDYAYVERDLAWVVPDTDPATVGSATCRNGTETLASQGPVPGGHERDQTDRGIRNLGGNVSEWTSDVYVPFDDLCWGDHPQVPWVSPRCEPEQAPGAARATRGGSWKWTALRSAERARMAPGSYSWIGFRCAKSF